MEAIKGTEYSNWRPTSKLSSEIYLHIGGLLLTGDRDLLAAKSDKLATLLKNTTSQELSIELPDFPGDQETLDLVSKFCHGFDINVSTTNVIRVAAVALFLGMTESQCRNNLLRKAEMFFEDHVVPSWNDSVKALKSAGSILKQAVETGLVDRCVESMIARAMDDPRVLGEPVMSFVSGEDSNYDHDENAYRPNPRRKLFDIDWRSEDLTSLSLRIYSPVMQEMLRRQVPEEYVAANVCQYAKKWLFEKVDDSSSICVKNYWRDLVEELENILPHKKGIVTSTFLFEMLKYAMSLDAKDECRHGLEVRIGKQLDLASVADLLIPMQGYAKDEQYDTECVRRILKHFYANYSSEDMSGLYAVAELIDEFLAEISADRDLKMTTFIAIADMSVAASKGTQRNADGLYRALDVYFDTHRHLTESEKDELCGFLDCSKLSTEAREHAALNQRLPLRTVVQILFFGQLTLRDAVLKEGGSEVSLVKMERDEEECAKESVNEEEVIAEIEKMGSKVLELERECDDMRREIQKGGVKKEQRSIWKEMKRKLGCGTSLHEIDCHVKKKKKVHPR